MPPRARATGRSRAAADDAVASAGSRPRSASFTARETPSSPARRGRSQSCRAARRPPPAQALTGRSGSASRRDRSGSDAPSLTAAAPRSSSSRPYSWSGTFATTARCAVTIRRRRAERPPPVRGGRPPLDVLPRLADAAPVANQLHQRVRELRAPAARDRHAAFLHRHRDHLRHEPRRRRIRPEPRVQDPRRQDGVRALRRERRFEPVAARLQKLRRERGETNAAEPAERLRAEREARPRPELGAEHAEGEVGVREEPLEHPGPLRLSSRGVSASRRRNDARCRSPVPVGRSALRYRSPRAASPSPRSACAAPLTQSDATH